LTAIPKIISNIAVAVSFDKRLDALLYCAVKLFARQNVSITLVNVISPEADRSTFSIAEESKPSFLKLLHSERERIAAQRLAILAATLPNSLKIKTKTLSGDVSSSLVKFAVEEKMDMILVGTTKKKDLGTAQKLINEKTVPVLIAHEDSYFFSSSGYQRIIVGDDLQKGGAVALLWSFEIAELVGNASILHSHVASPQELFNLGGNDKTTSYNSIEAGVLRLREKKKSLLKQRFSNVTGVDANSFDAIYENEYSYGYPPQELERSAAAFRANIAVFCAHQFYHPETSSEGQVPFRSMVDSSRLCLIVPSPSK
jgi:nucleotide-binding universal stress UspA family protein